MHLGVSYAATFPAAPIDAFKSDVATSGLEVLIERRRAEEVYAGLEWFLPTAVVVYIAKSYFDSFLKEMGKDHYIVLKRALSNFGRHFLFGDHRVYIASTKGKIDPSLPFSHSFSIVAEVRPRVTAKLLLQSDLNDSGYLEAVGAFINFLDHIHNGTRLQSEVKGFDGTWPIRGMLLFAFDTAEKQLEIVNAKSPAQRA